MNPACFHSFFHFRVFLSLSSLAVAVTFAFDAYLAPYLFLSDSAHALMTPVLDGHYQERVGSHRRVSLSLFFELYSSRLLYASRGACILSP